MILEKISKDKTLKATDIVKISGFSRAYINRFFNKLKKEGKINLIGKANKAFYIKADKTALKKIKRSLMTVRKVLRNQNLSEDLILDEIKKQSGIFSKLPKNISRIFDYAFTEMLNNAIEHSRSKNINVLVEKDGSKILFQVNDVGIGIFKNIMNSKQLRNELEAIQDLLKGKETTLPQEHSGEGIFFTSKVADRLVIKGSNKKLVFDNILNDIFVGDIKSIKGTRVDFEISFNSLRNISETFKKYTNEDFEFSKTGVTVKLYKGDSEYISRSQAKRILNGLEKFKEVTLDFRSIKVIGQAFADEIFRVWSKHHQGVKIISQNTNENIDFMVSRALTNYLSRDENDTKSSQA